MEKEYTIEEIKEIILDYILPTVLKDELGLGDAIIKTIKEKMKWHMRFWGLLKE